MHKALETLGTLHFIGIGGIGMSGIAEILTAMGCHVTGSDASENGNVRRLRALGITCHVGHDVAHVQGVDVVVVSSAIREDNPEVQEARRLRLPVVKRAEMLAEILRLRPAIAVAGTHGKTTTTSLGATVLHKVGLDPTVISGGIINAYGTNARLGKGDWTIVEADESDGTFTKLPATMAIVTNIDPEHMEYFGTEEALFKSFQTFINNLPFYGLGILCADHPQTMALAEKTQDRRVITYGFSDQADVRGVNLKVEGQHQFFDVMLSSKALYLMRRPEEDAIGLNYLLPMVGQHNVQNALSIITMGLEMGLSHDQIKQGLREFQGVKRRFTQVGSWNDVLFVDDYAHHPTEIQAVIRAAQTLGRGKIHVIAQPHRFSRFKDLYDQFLTCFDGADAIGITPIYSAGESPLIAPTHLQLVHDLSLRHGKSAFTFNTVEEVLAYVPEYTSAGDIVLFMGAGDITQWASQVAQKMQDQWSTHPEDQILKVG